MTSKKKAKTPPVLTLGTPSISRVSLLLSPSVTSVSSPSTISRMMTLTAGSDLGVAKIPLPTPNPIGSENTPTPILIERLFGPLAGSNPFDDSFKSFNNAQKEKKDDTPLEENEKKGTPKTDSPTPRRN